jgi:hypothetical protein
MKGARTDRVVPALSRKIAIHFREHLQLAGVTRTRLFAQTSPSTSAPCATRALRGTR